MTERETIQGFARGLRVLEAFGADQPRLSITDAARRAGLDRATARRCLLTLVELGYATFDGKFYALTQRALRLGQAYLATAPLPARVQPVIEQLAAATDESASVSVLDGDEIVYVARASRKRVMSINLGPGSRLPAYCSSMGRVLLAHLPAARTAALLRARPLPSMTPRTITDPTALEAELARVREAGYAIVDQELERGLRSIAAPIFDRSGEVVAALNIGTHAARVTVGTMRSVMLPLMRRAQADLRLTL